MIAMILISLLLLAGAGLAVFLLIYAESHYEPVAGSCGVAIASIVTIAAVAYGFKAWDWFASEYKASIINREYGTNYSREEVFFASDVIDTIRELDRKRIEVNGDLMTGKERAK
ncbi:hypothetical protein [Metapseudomonas otitidis]|uniref:hypothetical protein n=1 Tax=Metapseudomonas otitidis TaxID=319939 RepID=UPI00244ADB23|nr:hypothetical protein [Pseudomonas otitidis]MDH0335128.1 hypothetical protein [Pseudomonas otitidis]